MAAEGYLPYRENYKGQLACSEKINILIISIFSIEADFINKGDVTI